MTTITPKTTKKNPPAFAANVGSTGTPTTFSFVRPGPANWVCLCTTTKSRWRARNATRIAGSSRMCSV
ncbi:hypothetical protein BC477_12650 [Clavibacter michiganensis subsp. michiganensis]|uniref:Uncharacterized protein n=1 Tax=Clavibacter michiganensis subsp. michiganensis TaxID=33013 RepID=A0A251XHK0_CLAMM|nr:hypothetical protein BC477_12650 [Clavibacter michiganensis subsp. michiganensis]OUE02647.1 hypothetical protein CMMCAS07_11555 [Clavibacter michiganensis subsp. michiganensis]